MPSPIEYASLGLWDSLILLLLALVVFGPRRLPEIGRQLGRLLFEARKASSEFKSLMEEELYKADNVGQTEKPVTPAQIPAGTGTVANQSSVAATSVAEQAHHG